MMSEVSLETLPNVNIRDPSHNKNPPIIIFCECTINIKPQTFNNKTTKAK